MKQIYGFLKSQKTGIIVGFTVTGLLIIGSLIMNFFPESYEGLSGEDITFFYNNPRPIHTWFYIMFVAFAMYGISIFFCTLDSILRKVKARTSKIPLYGASIVHIGFLITLVAHLIGGIWSESGRPITIADTWVQAGEYELKVTGLDSTTYPNGMPRKITAQMKIRKDGKEYNDTRSQDLPKAYHDAGQFYWVDVKKYLKEKKLFSTDSIPVIIPRFLVQDIDTNHDWEFAERLYKANVVE